jgi:alpha-beta hydrolase superfamily lysophospholipase
MKSDSFNGQPYFANEACEPKAQVLILHGICEHGLRYAELSHSLQQNRISSAFTDHPGHGLHCKSGQLMNKTINAYAQNKNFNRLSSSFLHYKNTKTSKEFTDESIKKGAQLQFPEIVDYQISFLKFLFEKNVFTKELPLIIFGQSLGGLVCASMTHRLAEHNIKTAGAVFLSPAFGCAPAPSKGRGLFYKFIEKLENHFLNKCIEACSKKSLFKIFLLKPALKLNFQKDTGWAWKYISDLPEENHLFACDPLIRRKISFRFLYSILQTMVENMSKAAKFPCPFYTAYGTEDRIVDSHSTDLFIENYLKSNIGEKTKIKKMYNFMPHELHKSSCKQDIFNEISEWIIKLIEQDK